MPMHETPRDDEKRAEQLGLFGEIDVPKAGNRAEPPCETSSVDEIIRKGLDHLNAVTERTGAARFTSPTSIKARIQDGATLEDVLLVIDFCHAMWRGDPKMETFVRPKTLFGKENFPDYLARARKWQDEGRPNLREQESDREYTHGAAHYADPTKEAHR